jgi:hypothetical protein
MAGNNLSFQLVLNEGIGQQQAIIPWPPALLLSMSPEAVRQEPLVGLGMDEKRIIPCIRLLKARLNQGGQSVDEPAQGGAK